MPAWLGSDHDLPSGFRRLTPHCVLTWQKGQGSSVGLFYKKDTNPIHEGSTLMTYHLPKAPLPSTSPGGVRFQLTNFGGKHIQSLAHGDSTFPISRRESKHPPKSTDKDLVILSCTTRFQQHPRARTQMGRELIFVKWPLTTNDLIYIYHFIPQQLCK